MEVVAAISPMGTLQEVLEALSDPVRLEMVRRLDAAGAPVDCALLYDAVGKSTASHHFKVLREAGVTERLVVAGQTQQRLRTEDLEASFPGVLTSIVSAAARPTAAGSVS